MKEMDVGVVEIAETDGEKEVVESVIDEIEELV